jgi:hypothetical protein
MYAAAVLKVMLNTVEDGQGGVLPKELLPTDRILQRWDVSIGTGLPSEAWDDNPRTSRPSPLDDDTALVVDQIILHLPLRTNQLITAWYRTPQPTEVIADRLKMSARTLENGLKVCLNFTRWKFEQSGHRTLLKLLQVRV